MKKDTHPKYQEVLYVDSATGHKFICGSTVQTNQKGTYQGKEYPVLHVAISSSSHPFFVGGKQFVDTEGRVDKFTKRYQARQQQQQPQPKEEVKEAEKPAKKVAKTKKA